MVMAGMVAAAAVVAPVGAAQAADGDAWRAIRPYPTLANREVNDVEAAGGTEVWIAGSQVGSSPDARLPILQRWNGRNWWITAANGIGLEGRLYDLSAVSANDVWVVGNGEADEEGNASTYLAHWDGESWEQYAGPVTEWWQPEQRRLVAADSGGVWLVEAGDRLFRWDGASWTAGPDLDARVLAIESYGPDRAWARTESGLLHWDGTAWTDVALPAGALGADARFTGPDEAWTATPTGLAVWTGTGWQETAYPADYAGAAVTATSDDGWIYLRGAKYAWLKWTGSAWTEAAGGSVPDSDVVTDPEGRIWGVKTVSDGAKTTGRVVAFRNGTWQTLSPLLPSAHFDLVSLATGRIVGVGVDGEGGDLKGITNS
ncbi:hypothetical protein GCM10022221_73450 [Actinocorallia aurea]